MTFSLITFAAGVGFGFVIGALTVIGWGIWLSSTRERRQ